MKKIITFTILALIAGLFSTGLYAADKKKDKNTAEVTYVTTIDCKWDNPIPFAILPRCLVNFIYDSRNGIKTMPCMAERVDSMFTRSEKIREYPVFTGVSHLTLMSRNRKARGADCY